VIELGYSPGRATLVQIRKVIYLALTTPPLQYQVDANPVRTVPIENVVPTLQWHEQGKAPMPLVAYTVSAGTIRSRYLDLTPARARITVVSRHGADECMAIAFAIEARLALADQEGDPTRDLSNAAVQFALIFPTEQMDPAYERETSRYYVTMRYTIIAH
jgi:hypothetical protein